jgi:CspA family cold shock protein
MPTGRVKWYDKSKGYGFIESPEGDVFFHFTDIQMDGFKALAEDQRVSYQLLRTPEGLKAKKIRPLDRRATVRRAARYRTILLLKIRQGKAEEFDELIGKAPDWLEAFEQDVGIRGVGTWRREGVAVRLVESDKPYERSLQEAEDHPDFQKFRNWLDSQNALLVDEPTVMDAILGVPNRRQKQQVEAE